MKPTRLITTTLAAAVLFGTLAAYSQETTLKIDWSLSPGDRDYLTDDNRERGMDFNPATGHLIVAHRTPWATPVPAVIDGEDGEETGMLDADGINIGFSDFYLNKITVNEDGTIYGCNMTIDSADISFRIYRWADEEADWEIVYEGDPSDGDPSDGNRRFGDSIAVRGTGLDTRILVSNWNGGLVSLLTAVDEDTFEATPTPIPEGVENGDIRNLAFGPDNIVYGSHPGRPLHELELDADEPSLTVVRSFDGAIISSGIGPIDVNVEENLLVGMNTSTHQVMLYDRNHLTTEWTVQPIATRTFPTTVTNTNGTGDVAFGPGNRIYALHTNNGVLALDYEVGEPPEPIAAGEIYWSNETEVRTAELDGSDPRSLSGGLNRPIGIALDAANEHAYWAEDQGARIMRTALDGSDPELILDLPFIADSSGQFLDVNPSLGKMYWAEWTQGFFLADLDGENAEPVLELEDQLTTGVTVNRVTGQVYFGSAADGQIWRAESDGSDVTEIVELDGQTYGLAVDPATDRLYYTNFAAGVLGYFDLQNSTTTELLTGLGGPLGITVSSGGSRLYWAERTDGRIRTAEVTETGLGDPETLVSGEDSPFGIAVLPVTVEKDFDSWIAGFDVPEGQRGPQDDPDGDGIPNLVEYALGLHPLEPGTTALPEGVLETDGDADFLTLTINRNPEAAGIEFVVEVSSDLIDWESGEEHVTVLTNEPSLLKVRDNTTVTDGDRRFIRFRVIRD